MSPAGQGRTHTERKRKSRGVSLSFRRGYLLRHRDFEKKKIQKTKQALNNKKKKEALVTTA